VAEADLLRSLQLLALRQLFAGAGHQDYRPVDVVTMSLGYYHETPEDPSFDALLSGPLRVLGQHGVAVVVSAGNDASARPIYPAAFAPHPGGPQDDPSAVPVTAVGALNPNSTIALFSNEGPWVRFRRAGASLVSTMPTTYNASLQPTQAVRNTRREWRATIDADDFSSGFGVWSGTSFAAPVFAGQLAAELLRRRLDPEAAAETPVTRLRDLLQSMPGRIQHPAQTGSVPS